MTARRKWIRGALAVGLLVLVAEQTWRHGHDYIFADRFAVVEPGRIYRGAWQKPWPMKRLIQDYKIKTIVALAHPPDHALPQQEKELAREMGVRWEHVPIVDLRGLNDRDGISDQLEIAASIIADPKNQPVYFHCHHGINRASMAQMAYRMLYCGWTLEQASDEIDRNFGLVEASRGPDYRHMQAFYHDRVLPRRLVTQAKAAAETAKAATPEAPVKK